MIHIEEVEEVISCGKYSKFKTGIPPILSKEFQRKNIQLIDLLGLGNEQGARYTISIKK
ncbi:hypothetical protein D104_09555 [Marinomonas profundimaris]|uniref:Uncharacterized protein n=1 Tax=Marinomonas profundimaris TaxID=1208321 RepID=W1RU71_9GAMM|nr:hypothetical protein D104_09555 [Marinomonas profundimaris]